MKAIVFDKDLNIKDVNKPDPAQNDVLIKITQAGICNTDIEISRGYMPGFKGILGHEFIGHVENSPDTSLNGKRVTGEINCACGKCKLCKSGLGRHCLSRTVIGIAGREGAFAQYITVPRENVIPIPDSIPETSAIFIEPLAAALEILEQVSIKPEQSVLLIGDGKLAQLIAIVLQSTKCSLTVLGKHNDKLQYLQNKGIRTILKDDFKPGIYDMVVEASGSAEAFSLGLSCVKPRGTYILKSTYAEGFLFNPASIIINEVTLIGSRCGRFEESIRFLCENKPDLSYLISKRFELTDGLEALRVSQQKGILKVVLDIN